jgi:hypothetical protein
MEYSGALMNQHFRGAGATVHMTIQHTLIRSCFVATQHLARTGIWNRPIGLTRLRSLSLNQASITQPLNQLSDTQTHPSVNSESATAPGATRAGTALADSTSNSSIACIS